MTNSRKRKSLNVEYIKLNRDTTKLDMSLEVQNFNIEIMTVEVGNTEMKKDEIIERIIQVLGIIESFVIKLDQDRVSSLPLTDALRILRTAVEPKDVKDSIDYDE